MRSNKLSVFQQFTSRFPTTHSLWIVGILLSGCGGKSVGGSADEGDNIDDFDNCSPQMECVEGGELWACGSDDVLESNAVYWYWVADDGTITMDFGTDGVAGYEECSE